RAIIAATDQDTVNIGIAVDAKRMCPEVTVVVRLFDQGLARQVERSFDVRRAFGMSTVAAPGFAAAALGDQLLASFPIAGVPYVVARMQVDEESQLPGTSVHALSAANSLVAIALDRPSVGCTPAPEPDC